MDKQTLISIDWLHIQYEEKNSYFIYQRITNPAWHSKPLTKRNLN